MNIDVQRHSISIITKKYPSKQLRHRHPTTASAFHRNQLSHGTGASFDYGSMKWLEYIGSPTGWDACASQVITQSPNVSSSHLDSSPEQVHAVIRGWRVAIYLLNSNMDLSK